MIKFKHKKQRKRGKNMEQIKTGQKVEKKTKIFKKVLLVVLIILCVLLVVFVRRASILATIDKKVSDCENNSNNFYIKSVYQSKNKNFTTEIYVKDEINKLVMENTNQDGKKIKITEITYPEERKVFTEVENSKTMNDYKGKTAVRGAHMENQVEASHTTLMNPAYSTAINERIINAIGTRIKSVKIDGKDCYELSSLTNTNFLYDVNTTQMLIYVEKNTGLTLKMVQEIKENGETKQIVRNYEYKFNQVTDEEVKEPDNSECKMQENS